MDLTLLALPMDLTLPMDLLALTRERRERAPS